MRTTMANAIVASVETPDEPTISVAEAGRLLGISQGHAYKATRDGDIPTVRIGRSLRVPTVWVRRVLQLEEKAQSGALR
jgi:excisionase family DNA binding protein